MGERRHTKTTQYVTSDWPSGAVDEMENDRRNQEVRTGVARAMSDNEIALSVGISSRTVWRIRHRLGLPSGWTLR